MESKNPGSQKWSRAPKDFPELYLRSAGWKLIILRVRHLLRWILVRGNPWAPVIIFGNQDFLIPSLYSSNLRRKTVGYSSQKVGENFPEVWKMISRFFLLKLDEFTDRIKTSWFPKMITGLIGFPLTTKLLDVFKVRGWEKSRLLFKNTFFCHTRVFFWDLYNEHLTEIGRFDNIGENRIFVSRKVYHFCKIRV